MDGESLDIRQNNIEACKAGYKTIADISRERIRRVIKKMEKVFTGNNKLKINTALHMRDAGVEFKTI